MNRIKIPSGSKQKLETVFDDLQDYTKENIVKRFSYIFGTYGAVNNTVAGTNIATSNGLRLRTDISGSYPTKFTIGTGDAMAENGEIIEVTSTITASLSTYVTLQASSYYLIKLNWKLTGSSPIPAMSGFKYDPTGTSIYSQKYSKYLDDYEITVSKITSGDSSYLTNNVDSDEIALGIIKTDASGTTLDETSWSYNGLTAVDGVIDLRGVKHLKISSKVLPDNLLLFKDRNSLGSNKVNGQIEFLKVLTPEITGISGWMKVLADDNTALVRHDLTNKRVGILIDPEYTLHVNGGVGVEGSGRIKGSLTVDNWITSYGRRVMLEPINASGIAPSILNFNLEEITGTYRDVDSSVESKTSNYLKGGLSDHLAAHLVWNYDDVVGTGGLNSFSATCSGIFTSNQLAGYYLYIPSVAKNLVISGNSATSGDTTSLSVYEQDGTSWSGTGVTVDSNNPAWIHSNADWYELVAIPRVNNVPITKDAVRMEVYGANNVAAELEAVMNLQAGRRYIYKVRGVKGTDYTPWVTYPIAGDSLLVHPNITNDGSLSAESTSYGFAVTIQGWASAEQYEICYAAGATPDFKNPNHEKIITSDKYLEIKTSVSAQYKVQARPLIGGQQVITDEQVTATQVQVTSGGGGNLPQDQVIVDTDIFLTVYEISTLTWDAVNEKVTATGISTPNGLSSKSKLKSDVVGTVITDVNNKDFVITDSDSTEAKIVAAENTDVEEPTTGAAKIGVSKRGRRVYRSKEFSIDYEIVQIAIDVSSLVGTKATMRFYQEGREDLAESIQITNSNTAYVAESDLRLLSIYGSRNLVIDLWDPATSGAVNTSSLRAHVTVYARPKPTKRKLDYELDRTIDANIITRR